LDKLDPRTHVPRSYNVVNWRETLSRLVLLTIGSLLYSLSVRLFYVPADIAPSGVSGIAVILNHLIGTPIGIMILIGNIPIQLLAYRTLGGWQIVARTVFVLLLYSLTVDLFAAYLPATGITDDKLLNTLYGGIVGGIAGGLIYRAGGTLGGTSTL